MQTDFHTIVLGCGGIGSGALYWLARRLGKDALGLEQFKIGHERGGSQDHSRIIRLMYHDAKYTRLTPHTFTAWATVEEESGVQLVLRTGGLELADARSRYIADIDRYATAMDAAAIPYERLDDAEIRRRFPQFRGETPMVGLHEPSAGLVDAAKGISTHLALARGYGATVLDECPILRIDPFNQNGSGGVRLHTAQGIFNAQQLIVTAGAWTQPLLAPLGLDLPLTVTQEQVTYYATPHLRQFAPDRFPIWIWKDRLDYYGFPVYGEVATKAGIDAAGEPVTAESRSFDPNPAVEKQLDDFLAAHIPDFLGPKLLSKTCLYTMPPDRDFIVDHLADYPQIWVCVGAGHAYKFASLLGKILSGLAIDGRTEHDITPFTLARPAIQDKSYQALFHI
jgi:sarcosine oxidase